MTKEKIEKLLDSTVYQDVLLGIEYITENYEREWFEENILKVQNNRRSERRDNPYRYRTMNCYPHNDVILVWGEYYYVWDSLEIWTAGKDPGVIMKGDIIINL